MKKSFVPCLAIAGMLAASGAALAAGQGDQSGRTSQLIIKLSEYSGGRARFGVSNSQMAAIEGAAGVELAMVRAMSGDARVFSLPNQMSQDEAASIAERIQSLPGVEYAVADRIMYPTAAEGVVPMPIPNDPRFPEQWHYYEGTAGIRLIGAWNQTIGDPSVHVAVIDTGIRGGHEDLAGQWSGGYDFIASLSNSRDGDGRDPDPTDPGDYAGPFSSSWHGSHVAGTIGAATNNGIGVAGIAYGATLQPVRVLGPQGGFTSDILDAIRWSAGLAVPGVPNNPNPAQVQNLSLGGPGACDIAWQRAVNDAILAGSVVVVAAGNSDAPASEFTPSSCDRLITVGSVDRTGDKAWYSNYGSDVEISAPGGDTGVGDGSSGVLSTVDTGTTVPTGDGYAYFQGTSMASPHVAGIVALMLSVNPNLTHGQIIRALQLSAKPFPGGSDCATIADYCGAGIVDAAKAVAMANWLAGS